MSSSQMFCVKDSTSSEVCRCLEQFNENIKGTYKITKEQSGDNILHIFESFKGNVLVKLGESHFYADKYLEFISKSLLKPALFLFQGSDEFWYYELFIKGNMVDTMYSNLNIDIDRKKTPGIYKEKNGSPDTLAQYWSCNKAIIENYYRNRGDLNEHELNKKAYPEDEFTFGDEWQIIDFMDKLNIKYPFNENGKILLNGINYFMDNKYCQLENYEEIMKEAWNEAFNEDLPDNW